MNIAFLEECEAEVAHRVKAELPTYVGSFQPVIDALFHLPYFTGYSVEPETPAGAYHTFATERYICSPYVSWNVVSLSSRGHYLEAVIILRHLLEVFVQIRYFQSHTDSLLAHWLGDKTVRFKVMFEALAPGYYDQYYSRLCGFVHGSHASTIFQIEYESATTGRVIHGVEYSEIALSYVLNQLRPLLMGLFQQFNRSFPANCIATDKAACDKVVLACNLLREGIDNHKMINPASADWYSMTGTVRNMKHPPVDSYAGICAPYFQWWRSPNVTVGK